MQATALPDAGGCRGDIFNADGRLMCTRSIAPPPGSYLQSCEKVAIDGDDLRAICRSTAGYRVAAKLASFRHCTAPIDNVDGSLVCHAMGNPHGSYESSCAVTELSATRLVALCRTSGGTQQATSLADFTGCPRDIANDNGRLVCRP